MMKEQRFKQKNSSVTKNIQSRNGSNDTEHVDEKYKKK